jgi:5-formyltetrahydrofolate cyclo-ligase
VKEKKAELRAAVAKRTAAFTDTYIKESDAGIYRRLLELPQYMSAASVLLYCSLGREPATGELARDALSRGKTAAFPVSGAGGIMLARTVRSLAELVPGRFGIFAPPESAPLLPPEAIDLIIVPALAFDGDCYRLGRGGGYYDRYLLGAESAYTAGLCREKLLLDSVPRESHDLPVAAVITEERIIYA